MRILRSHLPPSFLRLVAMAGLLTPGAATVRAGSGPYRVAVLVNDNSRDSQELAQYYQEVRGIPEAHLVHLDAPTNDTISRANFESQILLPLTNYLAEAGLDGQIDTVVYTRGLPYRVADGTSYNGITAATFYGFKVYPPPSSEECTLPAETASGYYAAEQDFTDANPAGAAYLSTFLTAWDLAEAKTLVDRSVIADHTAPTSQVLYLHTTDAARNIRWTQTEDADFARRLFNPLQSGTFIDGNATTGQTNIMGYLTGLVGVSGIEANSYLPGALADHLTSFGGILYTSSQMSILDWISAGASGSYGTVTEPCNYPEKFPHARVHSWYARGFNLAESYTMSVANPYMGVIVGDPLCAPYAIPPVVTIAGLDGAPIVTGDVPVTVTADAATPDRPVNRIDLYLDERFAMTLTNLAFAGGEEVALAIGPRSRSYTVSASDEVTDVAAGLANAINRAGPGFVLNARASGDRVELIQSAPGSPGSGIAYNVLVSGSVGSPLAAIPAGDNLVESPYSARREITAVGTPVAGDALQLVVTRLDAARVTNTVTATAGESAVSLMTRLATAVNNDPALTDNGGVQLRYVSSTVPLTGSAGASAYVEARNTGYQTYNIEIDYAVTPASGSALSGPAVSGKLTDNADVMAARGLVSIVRGQPQLSAPAVLESASLADGPHTLRAVAFDGTAARVQGSTIAAFVVDNQALACQLLSPGGQEAFLYGQDIPLAAAAGGGGGAVTSVQFLAEGRICAEISAPPYQATLLTTAVGIGHVTLQARAVTDTGETTLSDPVELLILNPDDSDGDGLPDGWETLHFTNLTFTAGTSDADGDGQNDATEYVADTDPTDPHHLFQITQLRLDESAFVIRFPTRSTRRYAVQQNPDFPANPTAWIPTPPAWFPGLPAETAYTGTISSTTDSLRLAAQAP